MTPINKANRSQRKVRFRSPQLADGQLIYRLIANSPPLDLNSLYAYLLLIHHHAATCVIAEIDDQIVGFISAYIPPQHNSTLFVWQVAIAAECRGEGIASQMLDFLLIHTAQHEIRWLETTISPSNTGSQRLFQAIARDFATDCQISPLFPIELFSADAHEAEDLYRIGPLPKVTSQYAQL